MSKKKLLVILGAGSSVPCGMPSVAKIGEEMKKWAKSLSGPDYFNFLWDARFKYYNDSSPRFDCNLTPNFESVLGDMIALANWGRPAPWGNVLSQAVLDGRLPAHLTYGGKWTGPLILDRAAKLLGELARHMRERGRSLTIDADQLKRYNSIISRLRDEFELGIYNLNYDPVAITVWPEAFNGFDDNRHFAPGTVLSRREWNFIYHLHGSVHHSLESQYGQEIFWQQDLDTKFFDGDHGSNNRESENKTFPRATLIAGGFKLDQLLIEPFQSLHASLIRHAHEADAILIAGYGFGDAHVNQALRNRLLRNGTRPPVMVITKSNEDSEPIVKRLHKDIWSWSLTQALAANFSDELGLSPGCSFVANLVDRRSFEKAIDPCRVAIWHGGFIEARDCQDGIVRWLSGP